MKLERGINKRITQTLAMPEGCSHLNELALNAVSMAINAKLGLSLDWDEWVERRHSEKEFIAGAMPLLKNSCLPFKKG